LAVADAVRKSMLATAQQRLTAFKSANDNSLQSAASSISSPLSGVVGDARSRLESAQDAVKDAQKSLTDAAKSAKAEPMANASKTDPALDPYLSRNASVYYGTATEQFYKEISWQDASLNAANQALSVDQEALQAQQEALQTAQQELATAQAQYDQLQSIASSANRMAESKMDPAAIGDAIAAKLASAGFKRRRSRWRKPREALLWQRQKPKCKRRLRRFPFP
jgi:DNA repair exonuclease SbcCD ATPase subunit